MRKQREGGSRVSKQAAWVVAVLAAFVSLSVSGSAGATTGPGQSYILRAVMTDSKITIVRTRNDAPYIKPGGMKAAFQRGVVITFRVVNKGTKPLVPAVHVVNSANANPYDHPLQYYTAQRAALPGKSVDLQINFYFRAPFQLLELYHHKPVGKRVSISIS